MARSKKDIQLIDSHLRMPIMYFSELDKMFSKSLDKAPWLLHKIIWKVEEEARKNMEDTVENKLYYRYGIPAQYVGELEVTAKKEVKDTVASLCKNIKKFSQSATILYIHSPFEAAAMATGAMLCKAALHASVNTFMLAYPDFLEECKDFKGVNKDAQSVANKAEILCLYMVGKEYTTEFTLANLKALLMSRKVAGKTTIVTSHLKYGDFVARYGSELSLVALECEDTKEIDSMRALRRMVES